jgi:hypothetical protein
MATENNYLITNFSLTILTLGHIYVRMATTSSILVNEVIDTQSLSEADVDKMQSEMDLSQKLSNYVSNKWKHIQRVKDKREFTKEFAVTTKQLMRVRNAATPQSLLASNVDKLVHLWGLVLDTPQAHHLGVKLSDLRGLVESPQQSI